MSAALPQIMGAPKLSAQDCATIEARIEAAVAANPHCPPNAVLRRRALVIAQGPSGGPEALAILRSEIWPVSPFGPLVVWCGLGAKESEAGFEVKHFALAGMSEGPSRALAFAQLHDEISKSTTVHLAKGVRGAQYGDFENAVLELCESITSYTRQGVEADLGAAAQGRVDAN